MAYGVGPLLQSESPAAELHDGTPDHWTQQVTRLHEGLLTLAGTDSVGLGFAVQRQERVALGMKTESRLTGAYRRRPLSLIGGYLTLAITAALGARLVAIGKPEIATTLLPALGIGIAVLVRPGSPGVLTLGSVGLIITMVPFLIGGLGFIYLPVAVILLWGAVDASRR